jgi:hypothetical protein
MTDSGVAGDGHTQSSTGGGGGGETMSDFAGGHSRPDELDTGAESVAAASGPQSDFGNLMGDPRDLVQRGGGNSSTHASDDLHAALSATISDTANATMDKTSIANDAVDDADNAFVKGALGVAAAGAILGSPQLAAGAGGVAALYEAARAGDDLIDNAASEAITQPEVHEKKVDIFLDAIQRNELDKATGFSSDPALDPNGQSRGDNEYSLEALKRYHAVSDATTGKGMVRYEDPHDDRPGGPPSESELLLRNATNRLLGRNDALVKGPATQIDPGEQGEVFTRGNALAPDPQAQKESMIGIPNETSGPRPSGGGIAPPGPGPDGTEVLVEDGNPFTGGQRTEGPEDVQFGTPDPLIGFDDSSSEDDALPPEDDTDSKPEKLSRQFVAIGDDHD